MAFWLRKVRASGLRLKVLQLSGALASTSREPLFDVHFHVLKFRSATRLTDVVPDSSPYKSSQQHRGFVKAIRARLSILVVVSGG